MVSIANVVEHIIKDKPFMQEALSRGILNYAALAEQLTPRIEKQLKKKVKHAAVMMALRRTAEKLEKKFKQKLPTEKAKDVTIVSNLFIMTLVKTPETINSIKKLYKWIDVGDDILTVTQGMHEMAIISNNKHFSKINRVFSKDCEKQIKKVIKDVASITISVPRSSIIIPGFFFFITRALAWENINVIEIVSTHAELTLILTEDDVTKAYNILRE